jgi:aryl-alcohol dehydrogenase-like predicted oxidoreductase
MSSSTYSRVIRVYGRGESERIIRQCLESLSPEQKKNVVVATKALPFPTPQNWFIWSPGTVNALRKSLARLGLDSVDLYRAQALSLPFEFPACASI